MMSEIIYLKDILLVKAKEKNKKAKSGRPKLKPFKYDRKIKSSLVEKNKKKDEKHRI
ncbi:MAG: hypothetical protein LBB29_04000 [Holosporaceae bacterium]|jgi:hypothetical protein|nr:hypothetical protein [Holosporaceae bacterium]